MTLSVYGGSGFIGRNFIKRFDGCTQIQRDERKPHSKDILYFISTVDNYNIFDNITLDVDTNLKILCEVLDHCRDSEITFNFISSWFVYGKNQYMPVKEDAICNPTGFYSITKKCAEDLLISFCNPLADAVDFSFRNLPILRRKRDLGLGINSGISSQINAKSRVVLSLLSTRFILLASFLIPYSKC